MRRPFIMRFFVELSSRVIFIPTCITQAMRFDLYFIAVEIFDVKQHSGIDW